MKRFMIKGLLAIAALVMVATQADAQRTGKKKPAATNQPAGNEQEVTNASNVPTYNPNINIPITYDTANATSGAPKPSMRNDNAFDKSAVNDRTPLPYEHLRWDDALYAEKVWRELDLREKMNMPFRFESENDNGSQLFVDILLNAVRKGEVTAFSDDRFTTPLTLDDVNKQTAGGYDTADQVDINDPSKIIARVVTMKTFDSKTVLKLRLKEEWVFDRESSRMFVRILGIAPVQIRYAENGQERGTVVMFWLYYPDLRALLAKNEVYNPKNMGLGRMTWEELFEARMFSSYITKSTLDNPSNKVIRQYIKDPILALLEGDNIKNKIFDYEQNLWSY
ncbi:MAG: gliding motility protein GldN [Chitinophagaceae bacterium]|nr:gliding motility protein GldN [Chitinophagaceae bacterium]MBN8668978.1 gliding motility protein GldN [Chitinophagales bacterium]MDX1955099.1 gliding motility protein GldN [Chitinophagaceae bacterium]